MKTSKLTLGLAALFATLVAYAFTLAPPSGAAAAPAVSTFATPGKKTTLIVGMGVTYNLNPPPGYHIVYRCCPETASVVKDAPGTPPPGAGEFTFAFAGLTAHAQGALPPLVWVPLDGNDARRIRPALPEAPDADGDGKLRMNPPAHAQAALPPPVFGWSASPWARDVKITRMLVGGSGIARAFVSGTNQKLCNGGGADDGGGEAYQSCTCALKTPSDAEYVYTVREYAIDGRLVRTTRAASAGGGWDVVRVP